jgi:type 1 glutamine amidotransferase
MKHALIVWGGWHGHEPEQCAHIVRDMLLRKRLRRAYRDAHQRICDPEIARLDLIVPIYTMSKIEKDECTNLSAAVRDGVGWQVSTVACAMPSATRSNTSS